MIDRKSISTAAVLLATDHGEGMHSNIPKVLHKLLGRPAIWYTLEAAQGAVGAKPVLVISPHTEVVRAEIGEAAQFAIQEAPLGSGHAVMQTKSLLGDNTDYLLVVPADMPLLTSETLEQVITAHHQSAVQNSPAPPITIVSCPSGSRRALGVARDDIDAPAKSTAEFQASGEQDEAGAVDACLYSFTIDWLRQVSLQTPHAPIGEFKLIDLVQIAVAGGLPIQRLTMQNPQEGLKIQNRIQLAEAEAALQKRINESMMLNGVTLVDPKTTYIEPGVKIGTDTVIWPNTYLHGDTSIGENCIIGPNCSIHDTKIGDRCKVVFSVTEEAVLEHEVDIGPFAHLRKGAHLAEGVHMGNFGEVKNSYLGPGTKMGHFSYIGDANIGSGVNIGAGVITANYDGKRKYTTEIGAGAFIGSDSMLVAPVKIGEGASTGAGAVVTKDVPPNTLAVGIPARAIRKKEDDDGS
jgi:bifunctional UDP-N-acetylglucosamine pyrophosphorylase/glucosamine-1-phosphate N-acetyltransferase